LEATDLTIPGDRHVKVERLSLRAEARRFAFDADAEVPAAGKGKLAGTIEATDEGLVADATLRGGDVDLGELLADTDSGDGEAAEPKPRASSPWRSFLQGKVDVHLDSLRYRRLGWKPFHAEVSLGPGDPTVTVREAATCGIGTTGTAVLGPSSVEADVALAAKNEPIEQSISCLMGQEHALTGVYDLEGRLRGNGRPSEIVRWLMGSVQVDARQGRIHEMPIIAKTLATINVATGGIKSAADLRREGLPYDRISLRAEARNGRANLSEIVLEGPSVKMTGQGSVDLVDGSLDLTLLVAPLRTVDSVVGRVPLVGDVLGGSLISIPVRVEGKVGDPKVTPLDPSAVGSELKGLMERTLRIPGRALRPRKRSR
jgi:hypothetical protein